MVIFAIHSVGEVQVLEVIYRRVGLDGVDATQNGVYGKHPYVVWHASVNDSAVALHILAVHYSVLVKCSDASAYVLLVISYVLRLLSIEASAQTQ